MSPVIEKSDPGMDTYVGDVQRLFAIGLVPSSDSWPTRTNLTSFCELDSTPLYPASWPCELDLISSSVSLSAASSATEAGGAKDIFRLGDCDLGPGSERDEEADGSEDMMVRERSRVVLEGDGVS